MSVLQSVTFEEICGRGFIRDSDVARLQSLFYSDSPISELNARALIEINRACPIHDSSWLFFFAKAIAEFVVHEVEPSGSLTRANADWIIENLTQSGFTEIRAEFELLITALEWSHWSPPSLSALALSQVRRAVKDAAGPLRGGSTLQGGTITADDVDTLRRILNAFAGDLPIAVTRPEIDVLIEINSSIRTTPHCPEWIDLFVRSSANALLDASGYAVPQRRIALGHPTYATSANAANSTRPIEEQVARTIRSLMPFYRLQSKAQRAIARLERQRIAIVTNEEVPVHDAEWLIDCFFEQPEIERALVAMLNTLQDFGVELPLPVAAATRSRAGAA